MIHELDGRLKDWAGAVLKDVTVSLSPPSAQPKGSVVNLYLLQLAHLPAARGGKKRPPLQLLLRYLVTAWSEDPCDAHRMLEELVFAAMENDEFEVEFDAALAGLWSGFGTEPRPAFLLAVPLRREKPQPKVPLVRQGVSLATTSQVAVRGTVTGPGGIPLMGARVECPALNLSTQTDFKGSFSFSSVPAVHPPEFRATAKGKTLVLRATDNCLQGEALAIHFDNWE